MHTDKKDKGVEYFKMSKENLKKRPTLMSFVKKSAPASIENGVMADYDISLLIAKKGQSHTIVYTWQYKCPSKFEHSWAMNFY